MSKSKQPQNEPDRSQIRHVSQSSLSLQDFALFAVFMTSVVLVPMALFAIGEERGVTASVKYLIVGFAAAGAAYGMNRFAITVLAPLHALGFTLAGVVGILGISLTGLALALGTLVGLIFPSVESKVYQGHGQQLSAYIAAANQTALSVEQIAPGVEAIGDNMDATVACEIAESCLSLNPARGRGPMTRALEGYAGKALGIAETLREGELARAQLLRDLNALSAEYFEVLGDAGTSIRAQRADLQAIHGEIQQAVGELLEATPIALVASFADELRAGASLAGNPSGSRVLSDFLRAHGQNLAEQLEDMPDARLETRSFPDRPGMVDVLRFIPDFLAIAAIVFVGECVLPLTLYLMAYILRYREIEIMEGPIQQAEARSPFEGLIPDKWLNKRDDDAEAGS